jgi:hypothetical protein
MKIDKNKKIYIIYKIYIYNKLYKMNKFKFYKEKKNNPESRIGQRTWKYQKARDELSKVL